MDIVSEKPESYVHAEVTDKIIAAAIEVHRTLGPGLLESVYEKALAYEFDLRRINYSEQYCIGLLYKDKEVGHHRLDFLVEDSVVLEIKAVDVMHKIFEAQLLTYLQATRKRVGLIINFNVPLLKLGIKRMVL